MKVCSIICLILFYSPFICSGNSIDSSKYDTFKIGFFQLSDDDSLVIYRTEKFQFEYDFTTKVWSLGQITWLSYNSYQLVCWLDNHHGTHELLYETIVVNMYFPTDKSYMYKMTFPEVPNKSFSGEITILRLKLTEKNKNWLISFYHELLSSRF
jgi:hypothetical protein